MKKSTLWAVSAAMAFAPFYGYAQTGNGNVAKAKKASQVASKLFNLKKNGNIKRTDIAGVKFLPGTVKEYSFFSNGSEELTKTSYYTYDQYGNILTNRSLSAYNNNVSVLSYTYDSVETSFKTSKTETIYDSQSATTPFETRQLQKIDVVRNSKGQITEFTEYEANEDYSALEVLEKTAIEYGSDGKANKIEITEYDEGEELKLIFTNIVWEKYNGNLLTSLSDGSENIAFDKENIIKSADAELAGEGLTLPGTVTATYTSDTKREINISFSMYGVNFLSVGSYYEQTDNNGSYTSRETANYYGEEPEVEEERFVYNDNKDIIEETNLEGTSVDDLKITYSKKYEYGYNDEDLLPIHAIVSSYSSYTGTYEKAYRMEFSDYKDITDGINNAIVGNNSGNCTVFNAQGMYLGKDMNAASKGLYIVKKNGKFIKIMK